MENSEQFIRVIVADSQAIFRAGLRKIFAVEGDIRVIGQAETLEQAISAAKKFAAEILVFEAALAENQVEAVRELVKQAPELRLAVVTETPNEELTLDLFRHGVHAIVSREIDPHMFVECLRTIAKGDPWLEPHAVKWVLNAYRTQGAPVHVAPPKVQLTAKESLIISCVSQGMKNREIAVRVGTTQQVVKNYLRKLYDKLDVADRLELALYWLKQSSTMAEETRSAREEQKPAGKAEDQSVAGEVKERSEN